MGRLRLTAEDTLRLAGMQKHPFVRICDEIESLLDRHCALEREAAIAEAAKLCDDGRFIDNLPVRPKPLLRELQKQIRVLVKTNFLEAHDGALRAENAELRNVLTEIMGVWRQQGCDCESCMVLRIRAEALLKSPAPEARG
jgi:hypothetical protein